MRAAAEKAGRALRRDFGEIEKLQVSQKGPGDFVTNADLKAESIIREELQTARPGYGLLMEESGEIEVRTKPIAGSLTRWTAPPISCMAFPISPFPSRLSAKDALLPG